MHLAELDSLCREAIGLQSRDYGQYSPRHLEKDPTMLEKARGFMSNDPEDKGANDTRDQAKIDRAYEVRGALKKGGRV